MVRPRRDSHGNKAISPRNALQSEGTAKNDGRNAAEHAGYDGIDKERFLLMAAQVGGPCGNKLIQKFGNHHENQGEERQEAFGKVYAGDVESAYLEREKEKEEADEQQGIDTDGLPQCAAKKRVQLPILSCFNVAGIGRYFCRCPTERECLNTDKYFERDTHLSGGYRAVGSVKYGLEKLKNKISAYPTCGNLPLKWKNFLEVGDALADVCAPDAVQDFSKRCETEKEKGDKDVRDIADAQGVKFCTEGKTYEDADQIDNVFIEEVACYFLHLPQTLQI